MIGVCWQEGWSCGPVWRAAVGPFRLHAQEAGEQVWRVSLSDVEKPLTARILLLCNEGLRSEIEAKSALETALEVILQQRGWHIERLARGGLVSIVRPDRNLPKVENSSSDR